MFKKIFLLIFSITIISCSEKEYPSRNITLVVPYSPGGASDQTARVYAQMLEKELGVPVVVENRTGGAGSVGLAYVQKSKPNGYIMSYMPVESSMLEALGYVQLKPEDFTFLGRATIVPATVTVRSDSPWNTFEEFIEYAKANPQKIRIGNSGPGSIWHMAGIVLGREFGVEFTHIPFDGGASAVAGLLGNHIEAVTVSESEVLSGVLDGKLKILATMGDQRGTISKDIPTLKESGYNIVMMGWGGFAIPVNASQDILDKLIPASEKILKSAEFQEQMVERSLQPGYMDAESMQVFAKEQYDLFMQLAKEVNIK